MNDSPAFLVVGIAVVSLGVGYIIGSGQGQDFPRNYDPYAGAADARTQAEAARVCWSLLSGDLGELKKQLASAAACEKEGRTAH